LVLVYVSSFFSVLGFTTYLFILVYRHRNILSRMIGMMVSMGSAMMASLLIGTVLGVLFQQLTVPIIYSVLIGMVVGNLTGKPIHLVASLDGLLAGIMGGMMGVMLGVMVAPENPVLMVGFMNIVFVVIMLFLLRLIRQETLRSASRWPELIGPGSLPWRKHLSSIETTLHSSSDAGNKRVKSRPSERHPSLKNTASIRFYPAGRRDNRTPRHFRDR